MALHQGQDHQLPSVHVHVDPVRRAHDEPKLTHMRKSSHATYSDVRCPLPATRCPLPVTRYPNSQRAAQTNTSPRLQMKRMLRLRPTPQGNPSVVRVLLAGDTGVGKTSLGALLANGQVPAKPRPTVGCAVHVQVLESRDGSPPLQVSSAKALSNHACQPIPPCVGRDIPFAHAGGIHRRRGQRQVPRRRSCFVLPQHTRSRP